MTPELWDRLKPLYEKALDAPLDRRAQFAAEACGDDAQLLKELCNLLAATESNSGPLDRPFPNVQQILTDSSTTLASGQIIEGRFRIVRLLGSGGMGDVYEAEDVLLRHGRIALKTIKSEIAIEPTVLARFKEEVVLARRITGPNVCRIYELYISPKEADGVGAIGAFLTMEYLEGITLAERFSKSGPLELADALSISLQLCAALGTIHAAGVIHRDLKPRNIMLVPHEQAERLVVMDFGLARAFHAALPNAETALTLPGAVMGTPAYMAPEQLEGGEVTPATDIYALGIVFYELLTGKKPFNAARPFAAVVRRSRPPTAPSVVRPGVPAVWDDVIARCLEYDPAKRYASTDEVAKALRQHSLVLWRFEPGQRVALTPRSGGIVAAVLVAVLAVAAWFVFRAKPYQPAPTVAHWYDLGLTALREGTYLKATNALSMATQLDNNFALAHVRLADAWSELDSTGNAQREMLIASAPGRDKSLSALDRRYVDAVRSTLIRDYSAAAQDYEAILKDLPEDQKAEGFVDLGRAYEKAGRIPETLASYKQAAEKRPDDPAPFVHLGIWYSRQGKPDDAEAAFSHAEMLYEASSNLEGRAEVAYQRGYAANLEARDDAARKYLNESLDLARQIKSVQLEARALSQLSNLADAESKEDQAIELANEARDLAGEKYEYWSTDALMRLATAYLHKNDLDKAEAYAQQTLTKAQQNEHPRLEAAANFTLGSIRDQQGKPDEQIAFAQKALPYYRDFGFLGQASASSQLIIHGEERKGDFKQAQHDALEQLAIAQRLNSAPSIKDAEESLGSIALTLEDYPTALTHFQSALNIAETIHEDEVYQQLHCADVLWRLGRYHEAREMLAAVQPRFLEQQDLGMSFAEITAQMQLSQGKAKDALKTIHKEFLDFPDKAPKESDARRIAALAELQNRHPDEAKQDADEAISLAQKKGDAALVAAVELAQAQVSIGLHSTDPARKAAESAHAYFRAREETESEWTSLCVLAETAAISGDKATARQFAQQSLDIVNGMKQKWGSSIFSQYSSRPDVSNMLRALFSLSES